MQIDNIIRPDFPQWEKHKKNIQGNMEISLIVLQL